MQLQVHQLHCRRAGREIFTDLSFCLTAGDIAHVRGANGAGKSSLLALLAGLFVPASGTIRMGSERLPPNQCVELIAWCGHASALKPTLTLRENLITGLRILGSPTSDVEHALSKFGLVERADTPARFCSAGEQRRLALARTIAINRPLWLLDEPTTALDQLGQAQLSQALADHTLAGGIAIISTHSDISPAPTFTVNLSAPVHEPGATLQNGEATS